MRSVRYHRSDPARRSSVSYGLSSFAAKKYILGRLVGERDGVCLSWRRNRGASSSPDASSTGATRRSRCGGAPACPDLNLRSMAMHKHMYTFCIIASYASVPISAIGSAAWDEDT